MNYAIDPAVGCRYFLTGLRYLRSFHQMALPVNGSTHLIPAYYSIYRPRKDERLSWPSWLTYSGWLTHNSGHPSAAGRAQNRESSPAKDRRSTTMPRGTNFNSKLRSNSGQGLRHTISPTPPPSYNIRFVLLDIKGGIRNVSQSLHGTSNISSLSHSFRSSIFITLAASRTLRIRQHSTSQLFHCAINRGP